MPSEYRTSERLYKGTQQFLDDGKSVLEIAPEQILDDIHQGNYWFVKFSQGNKTVIRLNYRSATRFRRKLDNS